MGIRLDKFGSVFLPTKQLLAQQRFRPWKGVYLSREVLTEPCLPPMVWLTR